MRLFPLLGLFLGGFATASDQSSANFLVEQQRQRTQAVAASCRASLPITAEKTYYNVHGVLLEARDYCMFLAIEYVRQQLHGPAPEMSAADAANAAPSE